LDFLIPNPSSSSFIKMAWRTIIQYNLEISLYNFNHLPKIIMAHTRAIEVGVYCIPKRSTGRKAKSMPARKMSSFFERPLLSR